MGGRSQEDYGGALFIAAIAILAFIVLIIVLSSFAG